MNNSRVVSEKEIVQTIDELEETFEDLKTNCSILKQDIDSLKEIVSNFKVYLATNNNFNLFDKSSKDLSSLEGFIKRLCEYCNSTSVNIHYTTSLEDEVLRGNSYGS